jgi:signal transduction histidine kinase
MPHGAALATVGVMTDPAEERGLTLPLAHRLAAHRFSPAQLLALDLIAVTAVTVIFTFFMPRPQPRALAAVWAGYGWAAWAVAAVAVLFRRQWPRAALAVALTVAIVALSFRAGGPAAFFAALALYSVAVARSGRAVRVLGVLVAAAILAATIAGGGDQPVQASIGSVALVLLGWLAGENTRASRAYAHRLAERAAEQAAERAAAAAADRAEQVRRALAGERAGIARELHDIVAHAMSVIAVRSGVARMVIDTDPAQAREALGIIETTTRRSLREMRLLIGVLRADDEEEAALRPAPGLGDLDRLVADIAAAGVTVEVAVDGAPRALSPAADLSAYRIVQEALTNVVRHAGPTRARVRISYGAGEIGIEVTDDGPASSRPAGPVSAGRDGGGHGLIGMQERAALFGGELAAGPGLGGFRVRATLAVAAACDAPVSEAAGCAAVASDAAARCLPARDIRAHDAVAGDGAR